MEIVADPGGRLDSQTAVPGPDSQEERIRKNE
jgi:hypothetical protein